MILALLETGAEPDLKDYHEKTPLSCAAGSGSLGSILIVERLLSDPRVLSEASKAPSMAAGQGHEAIVQLLLEKGASPNDYSSLSHAVRIGAIELCRYYWKTAITPVVVTPCPLSPKK